MGTTGTAAGTGLRWCGARRHERVFGGAARGGTNGSSVVRHAAARTGLWWCGTRRHGRVFDGAARGGTNGSVSGAVLSGTIGYVTGGGGDAGERKARGGCIVERLRREKRNTPPRSLYYLPRSCAHTAQSSHSPGASPRVQPIYIASGTPHNPSTPGLDRVTGHDGRGRDSLAVHIVYAAGVDAGVPGWWCGVWVAFCSRAGG